MGRKFSRSDEERLWLLSGANSPPPSALQGLRQFFRYFQWLYFGLGILGNAAFFIGSIFFLWESWQPVGVWLFILGSLGMLISSIGNAIVKLEP